MKDGRHVFMIGVSSVLALLIYGLIGFTIVSLATGPRALGERTGRWCAKFQAGFEAGQAEARR